MLSSGEHGAAGIKVSTKGDLIFGDVSSNTVVQMSPDGAETNYFSHKGKTKTILGEGFGNPYDIAVDSKGRVYVIEWSRHTLKMIDIDG